MTNLRKAAEMALEALERGTTGLAIRAIPALRQALAQPEQEPVAWMVRDQVDGCRYPSALKNPVGSINGESQPLYTAPPKREWQSLTDDEIKAIVGQDWGGQPISGYTRSLFDKIDKKLKEKNGG
jgi:hypothetical protein